MNAKRYIPLFIAALAMPVTLHAEDDIGPDRAVELLSAGTIRGFEELNAAALAAHPGASISETELEHFLGRYIYSVELRDATGIRRDVALDASTGAVLSDREDD